jgi:hypothetical protein
LICHVRKTPTVLYGIFVEVVRQFYSHADYMPIMAPQGVVWRQRVEETKIWIDTEMRWEDKTPEFRPAIVVGLGTIDYMSLTGRSDGKMDTNIADAETFYSRTGIGTVTFRHIGSTDGEAVSLADATFDYLDAFTGVIRDDFCFTRLNVSQRVPIAQRQRESNERWGSVITMAFEFQDTWTLKLESQLLKKFSFNAGQGLLAGAIL